MGAALTIQEVADEIARRIGELSDDPTTAAREVRALRTFLAAQRVPEEWKRGIVHMIDQASALYDGLAVVRASRNGITKGGSS